LDVDHRNIRHYFRSNMSKRISAFHINGPSDSSLTLKRITPEPHVPSRGSQARKTRSSYSILRLDLVFKSTPEKLNGVQYIFCCWGKRLNCSRTHMNIILPILRKAVVLYIDNTEPKAFRIVLKAGQK
jgi:hypothetical protein